MQKDPNRTHQRFSTQVLRRRSFFLAHASGSCVGAYTASRPVPFMYMPDQP